MFYKKSCSWKFRNIYRKTPVLASLFSKETSTQVLSCKYYEIFKNTYFEEHQRTATSVEAVTQRCSVKKVFLEISKFLRTPFVTEHFRWQFLYFRKNLFEILIHLCLIMPTSLPDCNLFKSCLIFRPFLWNTQGILTG